MIKIKNYDDRKMMFETDMSINLANAIRRSALEIPIIAVDDLEIVRNDSALFDEIIANRVGLIPIKMDKTSSKEVRFKLKKEGPCVVYSSDIIPSVGTEFKLPIVILGEGQGIELVAVARNGKGINHVKHSPGLVYYKHNLREDILDFVYINNDGKVIVDEEELKDKGFSDEKIKELKKISEINELLFGIESWGQIPAKEIFTRALEVLDKNLSDLGKSVR
jgi:DNA-directed RNA polymerase subunit D